MPNKYKRTAKDILDLHQLTWEQARSEVLRFLENSHDSGYDLVRIITGKGIHSKEGAVLRDYVRDLLFEEGYEFSFAKISEGGDGAIDVKL